MSEPFERYPALASWIERLANTRSGLSLGDWMVFVGALNSAILQAERVNPLPTPEPVAEGWRDIASAPRDGTMVLISVPDSGSEGFFPLVAHFDSAWLLSATGRVIEAEPTHWRPLPAPPVRAMIEGDGASRTNSGEAASPKSERGAGH